MSVTAGGNPICPRCGSWYGPGERHECRHNHLTRDIKERGKCPACDDHWDRAEPAKKCNFFWGSHGCDRPRDGHRVHRCGTEPTPEEMLAVEIGDLDPDFLGTCCEYDEDGPAGARVRHDHGDAFNPDWGDWGPYGEGWRQ